MRAGEEQRQAGKAWGERSPRNTRAWSGQAEMEKSSQMEKTNPNEPESRHLGGKQIGFQALQMFISKNEELNGKP